MQEALDDSFHVTLMGSPQITALGQTQSIHPGQDGARIGGDADVLHLLALIVFFRFLPDPANPNPFAPGAYEVGRPWLTENFDPEGLARNRKKTRDSLAYALKKLHGALGIRTNDSTPEHTFLEVNLDHLAIDVRQIFIAARRLTKDENQEFVIRHGARRLLEGIGSSRSDLPVVREMRRRLDDCFLNALHCKVANLFAKINDANGSGDDDRAGEHRSAALFLIEQGRERLRAMGGEHPLAARFDELLSQIAPIPARSSPGRAEADALPARRHNIPRRITSFVGREAEMTKLETLLGTAHIVTIHGMGGCGKTRLALQAALEYAERTGEEAWLVELAGVADPALVSQAAAYALGLSEQKERTYEDALIERLRGGRPLLLLDNCEHLIDACALLTEKLVQSCPNLVVLATSRECLDIDGEYPIPIKPLDAPPADFTPDPSDPNAALLEYEAARLFLDRIRPYDVAATEENAAAIASICARLDGIPLALEMTAAHAAEFLLPEINARLTDRFLFLTNGKRTASPRHGTLYAVIEWSYDLLMEREQTLLRRLSVFAGGWTTEAAQSVGASGLIAESDVPGLLNGLLQKSLITADTADSPERYGMLETVREYALSRLRKRGESDAMQGRHRVFYLRLAEDAGTSLRGSEPESRLNRLETEHDNLRAALAWRADEDAMRLACALYRFWLIRSHFQEGRQHLERTWNEPERFPVALRATALMNAGSLACSQNDFPEAQVLLEASLDLWRTTADPVGTSEALYHLGITATFQRRFPEAGERLQESLAMALESENENGAMNARQALGRLVHAQDDLERARECYEPVLPYRRQQGDIVELADLLMYMGLVATYQDRRAEARDLYHESLAYATRLGRVYQIAQLNGALAELARNCGEYADARRYCDVSLEMMRKVGAKLGIASITNLDAAIAFDQEDFAAAEAGFEQAREMMLALGQELRGAGILLNIAGAAGKQGKNVRANELFRACLPGLLKFEAWQWIAACLEEIGYFEAQSKPSLRVALLLGATDMMRDLTSFFRTELEKTKSYQTLSELRALLGDDTFASAYSAGRAMTKEQAVAFALEGG